MANIYQLWDNTVLNSANATPEQLEQKRNELKLRFENTARKNGATSKDIYATLDRFDQYSRQKTTANDDGLTPDEREAARDDGSTILGYNKGGLKEGAKAIKDLGLGIVSSVPRVVGDLAQTWSDVGENNPSELSAQLARKAYDASEDIKSNYSEGTKQRKKDFWSPTGLAMGLGENLGQMALSAGLVGGATKGAMALSKGSKAWGLGAGLTTGMGLAYGQGYGQGKENALEKINNTSNEDLYANVVTEYDDWQKNGAKKSSKPEIVSLYEEAEGDLNKMKDLMAENAGNLTGLLTTATAPIAMGATAFANRGIVNEMARQGTGNIITRNLAAQTGARDAAEFARRVAARDAATGLGGKIAANTAIARQGLKIAGKQSGLQTVEEGTQEWGEGYFAADAGSLARGDKGVLSDKDWSEVNQQGLQGAAIGALMGTGTSLVTMRDAEKKGLAQAKAKSELPKQYQNAFNAFEDAKQAEAQAQAAYEANPTPESEEALAQATDARLKANNKFSQYDAAFKQTFTEQEQQDLLANSLSGIAARAKLAEEAKQAELNSKAEQEALAKAQRANMVKGLAAYADNEEVLLNEVNQLGLDDTQKELLLREVFAERKNAKAKPQQTQAKTPLELAVDEHFDAKGNRKPSVMSSDVADKHKVSLNELLPAIAKRNNDIKIQKAQAEKQAKVDAFNKSQAQQKTKDVQREQLAEQQQLENTLADFAAENDTESMLAMLDGYDKKEADRLFNNAFKTVETRAKEAEKATKAKEAEAAKQTQLKQKQSAFNADMSALYESNPNATYSDWKAVGKKYGVTSAIDLANAWASARANKTKKKDEQKPKNTETLALPSPNNIMVTDAQGNTTPTTENNVPKKQRNADISVPSGLNIDVSNAANTQRDRGVGSYIGNASNLIVRQDGKPFPTEQVAQQALTNKTTKKTKAKKNEPVISKETHTVVPVDGGYAIAPVEDIKQEPVSETKVEQPIIDDPSGDYVHSQFPDATATVTKTDKGYDVDWGDEVQSFVGKNAAEKTQAALKKENFNKKNPDDDNGGVAVEPTPNKPVSPVDNAQTTPKVTQNTTGEQIAEAMDKTAKAKPFSAPSENSPETTIMGFLNDDELENAYFFAENQDKPIKFTLSRRGEPIAYFLTEPVDLGNNITGFVGISTYPMSKSKRWLVIEEKSRTSIGFEEISKRAAIKSAKARLSALKKEDLEGFASKITPINKTDEEMKADWLAKNNIKIDEQSNEEVSTKKSAEDLAKAKAQAAPTRGEREAEKEKTKQSNNQKLKSILDDLLSLRDAKKETSVFIADDGKKYNKVQKSVSGRLSKKQYEEIRGIVGLQNSITIENTETKNSGINLTAQTTSEYGSFYAFSTEYILADELIPKKSDNEDLANQKFMPTFDDVMTHLKGIHKLSSELFKDAQTKAVIKNTLEDYLDKVMPNDVSAKDFKAILNKFFDEVVAKYPQTEYQSSGKLAHVIPEIRIAQKNPLKATASKSEFNKAFGVNESKIDEIAKDFERESQNESELTKQPTKKERLLIKIDDELDAALDDFAAIFKEQGKRLSSGVDPVIMGKVLAIGMKASTLYLAKGAVKFAVWAENIIAALSSKGVPQETVQPYLKGLYAASKMQVSPEIRQQMDKEDDVYDFDFAILNESTSQDTQNDTTPSQTSRDNVGGRDKTPESSQVQRASKSGLAQDNSEKRDDGVSANSGGRGDRSNLSNESGKSKTRSQEPDVASARNQSPKFTDSTRSTESSDGANLRNYRIQPNELKRTGSWKATAEQNVQIVELVKTIISQNRDATPEEKALLTKFTGWGASEIANGIFPNQYGQYKDANWKALGERLEAALSPEEYAQAKRTTQYAHYTSEPIIRSVYAALSRFGFNGGSLVEPGMGVGLFNGLMPDAMANNSQYTGIEYDTITGNIAKLLYPDSNIIVGDFTQTKLPKNFFDVAIGNPPFGSIKIQSDPEYKKQGFLLHDYFFAKTIDRVKEGGLLVFVTSKGTMDKASDRARKYLSERADLVGAIRLPQTAFKDNAGTEVVTDVIFLRKRMAGQEPAGEAWAGLKEITTPQGAASINEYFATHPEMILGKSALTGSMYRANEYTVEPIAGSDIETLFSEAINNLPENIYTPQRGSKAEQAAVQRRDYDPKIKKEGGIYVADDGVLMQVNNGQGTPLTKKQNSKHELVDLSPKEKEWLKDYVGVRDALKQAQYDQLQDNANWQQSLNTLNKTYDAFVKKHGFMLEHSVSERENEDGSTTVTKRFKNKSIMGLDAESALINALEQINGDNSISKAPALLGRVINKPSTPVITSTQDAMFVVFNELGRFDLAKVAKLINKSEKDVITELGDSIYEDPSQSWTTADDYLSGNVVRKLKEAEQAARLNPKYQRNVAALKAVQPPALAPQDINVQLGAAWIPASDIGLFASEVLGEQRFKVGYSPLTGQWSVEGTANYSSEWGIPAKDSKDILEAVLNNRQIKITYTDIDKKVHTDTESTEKANDIAKKMRESFKRWLWQDVPRTERLVTYYNEHFNNIAPRSFDGQHLTLPGVSSRFDLRPHQKRAIWRTIQQGDVYYAHAVGAGKTFTMIASGMEERRLGLVKKPMYVVPNHMLAQFSKEFLELYPMANIMVADEANFHTHNRRKFVAQAALNNPDAIVITHSAFGRIGMSSDYSAKFIKNQIADWQEALQEVGNDERITRKQIERRIEQLENKLKALLDGAKDQLLNFEELGVDRLYVDEGHEFRKLDFPTNRGNIKGIDPSGSQKSMDLYMKVEYLRSKNPNRSLVMASGTPVTNTMGELFTVQRFFNPSQLEEDGDSRFDAWSAHYGEVVDGLEQNAAGGYETVSRFAKFVNVPELMSRVRYFMDILTSNQLGDLVQRPDVLGGGRKMVITPTPDGFKEYQKDLERRIKAINARKAPPKSGDDIILKVITDGRFAPIDMRFVDSTLPSDPNSKLNRMLDDLISAYHETANNEYMTSGVVDENKGSSLMLFTNIGLGEQSAKNRGFDMKAWIEKRLIDGGVKREHIAFMRDNKAHSKKEKLFDDMRQGRKRILIGGKDMETGVNAQKRLTHLFHLDSVWFPSTVEQREGRIIRQGNQNRTVDIRGYATKGSYDSTMWGTVARKARFIEQAFRGDSSVRSMEDVSEASAFEMAAALASGDERYLKLAGLKGDVERLGRLYSAHIDEQKRFVREKNHLESSNKLSASKIEQINAAIAQRKPIKAGEFLANVGKNTFDNRDEFSKALFEKFKQVAESYKADEIELGSIAGFPIVYNGVELRGGNFAADLRVDLPIDVEPLAIFPIDPAYSITGIATRAVNQTNALDRELISRKNAIEQNTKDLARIGRRIGASFPEMAELNEKQQALNELEQELNAEGKADDDLSQTDNQEAEIEPSQKLKNMMELSKKRVHSVGQAIVDEHHFLAIGTSALTGQPIYALFNDDGRYFVVDIDSAKSNSAFSQEVIDKAKAVKQKLEQQDADFVKKYPDGVFSGTDAQVVSSENVPKKVTAYLDSLLKMLGMETRVFLATQKDINADAQAKYHIYGGHRSILSVQISTEESGVTRIIGINQKDSKDAYIAFNSDMSEAEMIEVVAHEVGHIIEKTLLRNATKETQEAIKADFQKWLASVKGITKKEHLALMRNRHVAERGMQNKADIMDTPNTNLSPYWFSFSEWFADNVSRWATTSEKPLSLVERFFADVAKKLKQLVLIIQGSKDSYKPSVSVRDYLDSIVRTDFTDELYNDEDFNSDSLEQSDNQETDSKPKFSQSSTIGDRTITQVREKLVKHFGEKIISLLEKKGILKIHQSLNDESVPNSVKNGGSNTDGAYDEGVIHLIADNLTDETILGTFVHELGVHKGFQEMMSPKAYELIMTQFNRLVEAKNPIALAAKQRAEEAESLTDEDKQGKTPQQILDMEKEALARQKDEYLPYLITKQAKNEQATPQQRNAVQRLIDHIVRAVKGWVVRTLSKYDTTYNMSRRVAESLTPADILYMAERMVGDIAKRGGDNNSRPKFGKSEQSQFDQLLAKADKMIAEQGKLLAPNGKPSKLNRYQWAQVRTDNFKNWFGDWENDPENSSKVVDENGEPLVVYHGSRTQNITEFYTWTGGIFGAGTYFTIRKHEAHGYSNDGVVYEAFINARKPLRVSEKAYDQSYFRPASQDEIIRLGYDSTITTTGINHNIDYVIAISPTQIKSAISNNGEFSSTNPDIRFSQLNTPQTQINAVRKKYEGTSQWMKAPNGEPTKLNEMQWLQVRTPNFKAWFGDWENDPENASKAVDENGEPKVVYHGSGQEFYIFDKKKATDSEGRKYGVGTGKGVFSFTENNDIASNWANRAKNRAEYGVKSDMPTVISAFLNIKRPITRNEFESMLDEKFIGYDFRLPKIRDKFISEIYTELKKKKIDGIMSDFGEITAFYPTQIKSAISNNGEFNPTNPDIRFSRAEDKAKAAKDYVLDSVRIKKEVAANLNAKKELGWWHKTLGTQQNTAIQHKDFGRVYKTLQRLLQHQSSDVTDALEVAPTLLEKLDDWKDFKNQVKAIGRNAWQGAKHKLTDAVTDRMAVAKVIFSETLAKEALSQADLEQKLTPQQLKIYEEARAAINVSLKNTAKSEIIRSLLQNDVINFDTVEKLLNQQTGFDEFIDEMLENVGARISNAQAELSQAKSAVRAGVKLITKAESDLVKATDKAQQKEIGKEIKLLTKTQEGLEKAEQEIKDELKRLADMYNSISDVNAKVYQLIDEAYAPLMRFGDYALTMRDKTTGKVLSFMMFESKAERNRMVNYLGTEYGDTVTLETDTMSTEDFKMFKGVTPETVALFAKELGLDKNEAYQGYLKLAIPATSALTRRIQRKGTAGYNEDIQRVVSAFVMSNARYSAKNIYLAKADREISEIESGASVRDQAKKMRDNTIDPADTFAWLRDLLFVWNLGFSVTFAFVNMTQPFLQTIPMLSQYVNTGFATKHVLRGIGVAGKAMATGNAPKGYEAEYKRAVHEGVVDPQNTFMLTGLERGGTGTTSKVWTGTKHILGIFAQMSESLNRKAVFIASLEVANAKGGAWLKQKGYASAYDFAVDVISQTQGVYNKANRSNWAHSQLGAPLLVFKQFSINYVEQMIRMLKNQNAGEEGKKAVLLMLFMLFSLAGGMGLPFIKDIFDGSETIAAFMGNPVNIEREMRLMGKQYLGETTTGALMDGWLNKLVIGEVLGADAQSRTGMGDLIPMTNVLNPVLRDSQRVSEAASIFGAAGGLGEKAGDSIQFAANDEWGDAFINILPHFATSMYRGVEMMTTGETTDSKGRKLFDTTFGEGLVKFFDSQPVRMAELSRARGLEYDDIAIQSSKIDYYKKKWIKAAQKEDMEAIEQIEQDIEDWNENNEKYPVIFDRQRAYQSANKNEMTWGEREERTPKGMEWLKEERPDFVRD